MHSLSFRDSLIAAPRSASAFRGGRCRLGVACILGALGVACGDGEDAGTVALADSASLDALTGTPLKIPTTVAVRDGVAWVVESQFDAYARFGGMEMVQPFRLFGVPLSGGDPQSISLPDGMFPEGITVSRGGNMFVGSVERGNIYVVRSGEEVAELFVSVGALQNSAIGLTVSNDSETLWVCDSNPTPAEGSLPTGAVVGIGIGDQEVKARHEFPASPIGAFCNDLVMSPDGALWATESFGGRIFRIAPDDLFTDNSAEPWLQHSELAGALPANGQPGDPFGVNGITLLGGQLFVVNSAIGTLLRIDPSLDEPDGSDIEAIALTEDGEPVALANPDGITALNGRDLLIVENGLNLPGEGRRLVRARIGGE